MEEGKQAEAYETVALAFRHSAQDQKSFSPSALRLADEPACPEFVEEVERFNSVKNEGLA
jgi:hypothetical protein